MKLTFTREDELFRDEVATWLDAHLRGDFAAIRYRGGPGDEHHFVDERKAWERQLADGRWTCIGWPEAWVGRAASIEQHHRKLLAHLAWSAQIALGRARALKVELNIVFLGDTDTAVHLYAAASVEKRRITGAGARH